MSSSLSFIPTRAAAATTLVLRFVHLSVGQHCGLFASVPQPRADNTFVFGKVVGQMVLPSASPLGRTSPDAPCGSRGSDQGDRR